MSEATQPPRVLIAGATSGIGAATAQRFADRGAHLALLGRSADGLHTVAARVRGAGSPCVELRADVTDRPALTAALTEAADALGRLDVVVVNAGAAAYGPFRDTSPEDFDRVVEVTFTGAVNTIRAALPHLERTGGHLVITGSVAADLPLPMMSAYTAAKQAVQGFADALAIELRAERSAVTVSLVEPGPIDTPFWVNIASQTGRLPPPIPLVYRAEEVAIAITRAAERGTGRTTVGGAMIPLRAAHRFARPLTSRLLAAATRLSRQRGGEGDGEAAIWRPAGHGELGLGRHGRRSATMRALNGLDGARRAARRLGGLRP